MEDKETSESYEENVLKGGGVCSIWKFGGFQKPNTDQRGNRLSGRMQRVKWKMDNTQNAMRKVRMVFSPWSKNTVRYSFQPWYNDASLYWVVLYLNITTLFKFPHKFIVSGYSAELRVQKESEMRKCEFKGVSNYSVCTYICLKSPIKAHLESGSDEDTGQKL